MLLAFGLIKCTIKMPERLPELMREICRGYEMGLKSRNLFGVKWEEMWSLPLEKVREELGVVVA
jgi:ubiquinone biosynthesis protein Coq4